MPDLYKKYELGRSLEGQDVVYIARNRHGFVAFRAQSEAELKEAIDKSIEEEEQNELEAQKQQNEQENISKTQDNSDAEQEIPSPSAPHSRVARGAHGKFVSKKKSFWDRLK